MDRSWLFADLAVPGTGCVDVRAAELVGTVVARLVAEVRTADPGVCWFFDRLDSPAPTRLRLGLHAGPAALDLARDRLGPAARPAPPAYTVRDPARGGPLAHAGSELALTLLGGEPPWLAGLELPLAVAHLRHLCGLVPAGDRAAFLFLHWQDRSRPLTGAQRRDLAAQAQAGADKIVLAAGDLPLAEDPVAAAWGRYLDRVGEVAAQDHPAAPRGFLIATHAQLSHRRWGIDPAVDSLAALALRMAGPGVSAPGGRAG
ncbi:hypothetical protein GA0070622_3919 [Micromonospora sediminicola]|uniref:Thiopeptide-type bacteriocin biosynthesis domain-containing protein n=1 Tax=Micromonospora sediminicola TaxID=946078 RepID=A0A1A9BBJ2_9ACTN|nr:MULTISPECIES: hypothetical protein [Micromonospora]PGH45026.1 hypothetical protein COO58_11805 [Micromonospora sp. WMMA1996]SBT66870.1 hypothetical protein GA0070622_3919 [Micromonospora sediminicola]